MIIRNFVFLWLLHLPFGVVAQQPVEVDDVVEERNFMPYELMYFQDSTNSVSFGQISSLLFANKFKQHTKYQNKDFIPNAVYWIRLPVHHIPHTQKIWLLEFYDQSIDKIEAYVPQQNGTYERLNLGDEQPFTNRLFRHKNFELMLDH